MKTMLAAAIAVLLAGRALCADSIVSLDSLLREMVDRDSAARWPSPEFTCRQASSYDRRKQSPANPVGWHSNKDYCQFLRAEEHPDRREWVMMDVDGPGCVVRFWTGGKPAVGTVRFYLDGAADPVIAAQLQDLLGGRAFVPPPLAVENPRQAGNLYLPIPYASHCKITYEEADPQKPDGPPPLRWYNIEYRSYAAGTPVKPFTMADLKAAEPLVKQVGTALLGGIRPEVSGRRSDMDRAIKPRKQRVLDLPAGPSAVRSLEMRLDDADAQAWRSLVIIGRFDGEQTIWCPAGDFFGSGVGVNVLESWNRRVTKDGSMTCRWAMPYRRSARFTLLNLGKKIINVKITAITSPWQWDDRSLHFHVNWRQQNPLPTRPMSDWNYLTAAGKGVYVGDTLCVLNPVPDWWGEGDEEIWVDGELFPSHLGTGTEDYYGGAWNFTALFQEPFANLVRCDGPDAFGQTVVTRTRRLDAIPFTRLLQFDMEVWHWKDCQVGCAATTYWYASPGAISNRSPSPDEAARPIANDPLLSPK